MTQPQEKTASLYMREGSSDKEYHLNLRSLDGGWCAFYANGPRGRVGTSKPIKEGVFSFEEANKHYEDKLKSKLKGGYTPSETGVRFANTEQARLASGHVQQLPTAITQSEMERLLDDRGFAAQEKANGERRSMEIADGQVRGINKLGLYVNLPENLVQAFSHFGDAFLDGEQVGTTFYGFDLLRLNGRDLRNEPFSARYTALKALLMSRAASGTGESLKLLQAAFTAAEKRALLQQVQSHQGEGLVFKRCDSLYDGGRSKDALKFKFCESSTCQVIAINQQRSVKLGLLNAAGAMVPVGNVTIPANYAVPAVGDLVEIQYLYYNPQGALEQPIFQGPRNDILPEEATLSQITRLKPGVGMDDMGAKVYLEEFSQEREEEDLDAQRPAG
jgi:bifunctional non-homologous end joining protein LigD